jgi:RNA recognition motif-containing protein
MSRAFSGGKRNREASRDLKKRQKEDRLRRNRELRARGIDPDVEDPTTAPPDAATGAGLPEVKLEDVVISVAPRSRRADFGPTKLFVGGLGPGTTAEDLRAFFAPFGTIVDVVVVADRSTGQSRGFGFVSYESSAAADGAIKGMNGVEVSGHTLTVNRAEPKPRRF